MAFMSNDGGLAMSGTFVVLAGWLIDGSGGPIHEDVRVFVTDGRIQSLHTRTGPAPISKPDRRRPPDPDSMTTARIVDHCDCTILPVLVDSHVHLFMSGTSDLEFRKRQLRLAYAKSRALIQRHLSEHLSHGVLAVRDGGDQGAYALRYKSEQPRKPSMPRIFSPGRAWRAQGRYGALIGSPPPMGHSLAQAIANGVEPIRFPPFCNGSSRSGEHLAARPDHVKIVNSGLNSMVCFGEETSPQFDLKSLRDAAIVCGKHDLKIMVHANGRTPVKMALQAGCDSIEHGFFMGKENLEHMAEKGTTWVPTACTMQAYARRLSENDPRYSIARRNLDHQLEQIALARDLGVTVAVGTDAGSFGVLHGRSVKMEIALLMKAGFPLEAAIRSATFHPSHLLGLTKELGLLQSGKPATFLAVKANPKELPAGLDRLQAIYVEGRAIVPPKSES